MSHPYTTPGFLRSSPSLAPSDPLDSSTAFTTGSDYTATSSGTIQPGTGYLSGKFFLSFGRTVLRGVENVVIWRRLSHIESLCPLSDSNPPKNVERVYDDMLELARPGLYSNRIREKTLETICEQIRRMQTLYLRRSLEKFAPLEKTIVTCEILAKVWRTIEPSDLPELDTIVSLYQQVLVRLAPQNPDHPIFLHRFSYTLSERFDRRGHLADLEEAIFLGREALELMTPPRSDRWYSLHSLAQTLSKRFDQTGQLADLYETVLLGREALELMPLPNSDRWNPLHSLAHTLWKRFNQTGHLVDLHEAVLLSREALELMPSPHAYRSKLHHSHAHYLSMLYDQTGQLADLERAIILGREALQLTPPPHSYRSVTLYNLACALSKRFDQTGRLADLEEAAVLGREALELYPTPHASKVLRGLARILSQQFHKQG